MKLPRLTQEPRFWLLLPVVFYFPLAFLFSPWKLLVGAMVLHLVSWLGVRFLLNRARRSAAGLTP